MKYFTVKDVEATDELLLLIPAPQGRGCRSFELYEPMIIPLKRRKPALVNGLAFFQRVYYEALDCLIEYMNDLLDTNEHKNIADLRLEVMWFTIDNFRYPREIKAFREARAEAGPWSPGSEKSAASDASIPDYGDLTDDGECWRLVVDDDE